MAKFVRSTRPRNHAERKRCITFIDTLAAETALPAALAVMVATVAAPSAAAYLAARAAKLAAAAAVTAARTRATEAGKAFRTAFFRWTCAVNGEAGERYVAAQITPHLGHHAPAEFLGLPARVRVVHMEALFAHIAVTPSLVGSPTALDALRSATDALDAAVTAHDDALEARADAVVAHDAAAATFDRDYGELVTSTQRRAPAHAGKIPVFFRAPGTPDTTDPSDVAADDDAADGDMEEDGAPDEPGEPEPNSTPSA